MVERVLKVFNSEELRTTLGFWLKANQATIIDEIVRGNVVQIEGTFPKKMMGFGLARVVVREKIEK
jgi:hypothetical protein